MNIMPESRLVEHVSNVAFVPTLERLVQAIETAGMTVFARIDHAAGAREIGMEMPPTVVLLYGHPRGGELRSCWHLPSRHSICHCGCWCARIDGRTLVSFHPIAPMLKQAGVSAALAARLEPAQSILSEAIQP